MVSLGFGFAKVRTEESGLENMPVAWRVGNWSCNNTKSSLAFL